MNIDRPKVLVADDEEDIRFVLTSILQDEGFETIEAEDGEAAKKIIESGENLSLIFSDQRMPGCTGKELFEWLRKNERKVPFLLCSAYGDIKNNAEAVDLGMNGFIEKPANPSELIDMAKKSLGEIVRQTILDDQYSKIGVHQVADGENLPYEIYARLSGEKYLKIANQSSDLDQDRIKKFVSNGVKYFYLKNEDFKTYLSNNYLLDKSAFDQSKIPFEKKKKLLTDLGRDIYEHAFLSGVDKESFSAAKQFVEMSVFAAAQDDVVFDLLEQMKTSKSDQYAHSIAVSTYCAMVYKNMGYTSDLNINHVALAGMFHDIGKLSLPKELLEKSESSLTSMEENQIKSHVAKGSHLLGQANSTPESVILAAEQHHEYCDGSGYPKGLHKGQIHPISHFVICVNDFVRRAVKHPNTPIGIQKTLKEMLLVEELYEPTVFASMVKLFRKEAKKGEAKAKKAA